MNKKKFAFATPVALGIPMVPVAASAQEITLADQVASHQTAATSLLSSGSGMVIAIVGALALIGIVVALLRKR